MLTGLRLYDSANPAERHQHARERARAEAARAARRATRPCSTGLLAKKPEDRFQSAARLCGLISRMNPEEQPLPRPARRGAASTARARPTAPAPARCRCSAASCASARPTLPAAHDEEAAPQVDHLRAAVVPARRHQREVAAGARRDDLGRVGRRERASSGRSTATSGATGARPDGGEIDQIARRHRVPREEARFAPPHRERVESRRRRAAWRCRRATRCSSSTSPTAGFRARCTSAAPTSSSACRSTSPPTLLLTLMVAQVTGLERRPSSCSRSATRTST